VPAKRASLFQSINLAGMEVTGRSFELLQRLGCDPEAGQSGRLSHPVGCHAWRATHITIRLRNKSRQCDKIVVIQDPEVHNALAIAEVHIRSWPAAQTGVATDEDLAGCSRQ
jgi:hypothetical protein